MHAIYYGQCAARIVTFNAAFSFGTPLPLPRSHTKQQQQKFTLKYS